MTRGDAAGGAMRDSDLRRIERFLGNLLRIGVGISIVLLVSGVLVSLIRHPDYMTDKSTLARLTTPGSAFPHSAETLIAELRQVRGRAIMTAGLLVLMATPVVRVGLSIVVFLIERDWWFALITTLVFLVLALSVFLGRVE